MNLLTAQSMLVRRQMNRRKPLLPWLPKRTKPAQDLPKKK